MDSYIVRIYRRAENNPQGLVGIIEKVGTGRNTAFKSAEELWTFLNAAADHSNGAAAGWRKRKTGSDPTHEDEE